MGGLIPPMFFSDSEIMPASGAKNDSAKTVVSDIIRKGRSAFFGIALGMIRGARVNPQYAVRFLKLCAGAFRKMNLFSKRAIFCP